MSFVQSDFGVFFVSYILTLLLTKLSVVKNQQVAFKKYLIIRFGIRYRMMAFLILMLFALAMPMVLTAMSFSDLTSSMPVGFALAIYFGLVNVPIPMNEKGE